MLYQPPNAFLEELGQKYCKFEPGIASNTFRRPLNPEWGKANGWLYFSFFSNQNDRGNIISDYYSGITFLLKKDQLFVINFRDDRRIYESIIDVAKELKSHYEVSLLVMETLFEEMKSRVAALKNEYDKEVETVNQKEEIETELDTIVEQLGRM